MYLYRPVTTCVIIPIYLLCPAQYLHLQNFPSRILHEEHNFSDISGWPNKMQGQTSNILILLNIFSKTELNIEVQPVDCPTWDVGALCKMTTFQILDSAGLVGIIILFLIFIQTVHFKYKIIFKLFKISVKRRREETHSFMRTKMIYPILVLSAYFWYRN